MIKIKKYTVDKFIIWNEFIANAKNGHFMFDRNYVEYHSDRFQDYSLMFYDKNTLLAVLPGSIKDSTVVSHGGLTFGGIISSDFFSSKFILPGYYSEHYW